MRVGDRVEYIGFTQWRGIKARILWIYQDDICIEFDENIYSHDGYNRKLGIRGKNRHCWITGEENLILLARNESEIEE